MNPNLFQEELDVSEDELRQNKTIQKIKDNKTKLKCDKNKYGKIDFES